MDGVPAGGAAEQVAERGRDPAVSLGAPSRSEQQLQVPEQQDAGLQGVGPPERRGQLGLGRGRSVGTQGHTVHLDAHSSSKPRDVSLLTR